MDRNSEFPICEKQIFLAHAGVSPLPRRVADAMKNYCEAVTRAGQEDVLPDGFVGETRQLAAELIGARREEIAFTGSTSMGLATVAAGLGWKAGENVVCYRDDYPANVHPWMNLAAQGVEVRYIEPRQYGNITVEDLARVVDAHTRLVSLASVHFISGWRLDVDAVGQFLHERGILFCLDGIQSFGALATKMTHVDFAAADAHKWLLGPLGIAILFVRKEHFDRLRPPLVGAHSAAAPDFQARERLEFWPDARRYEPGSFNLAGIVGLRAALELIRSTGLAEIERRVLELSRYAIETGRNRGLEVAGPAGGAGLSGIVSWEASDAAEWHKRLTLAGIATSLRRRRDGRACLRISPHFYNRIEDIDAVFTS
jgi:cysteine desulfurase/selenocysteine lyase